MIWSLHACVHAVMGLHRYHLETGVCAKEAQVMYGARDPPTASFKCMKQARTLRAPCTCALA